jgi:hypothetical protein
MLRKSVGMNFGIKQTHTFRWNVRIASAVSRPSSLTQSKTNAEDQYHSICRTGYDVEKGIAVSVVCGRAGISFGNWNCVQQGHDLQLPPASGEHIRVVHVAPLKQSTCEKTHLRLCSARLGRELFARCLPVWRFNQSERNFANPRAHPNNGDHEDDHLFVRSIELDLSILRGKGYQRKLGRMIA